MVGPRHGPASAAFYDAYLLFVERLNSEDFVLALDLVAGDVVAFDNRRVLHARTAFDARSARQLQGCYIDIDAVQSAARRAAPDLGIELTGDSITG